MHDVTNTITKPQKLDYIIQIKPSCNSSKTMRQKQFNIKLGQAETDIQTKGNMCEATKETTGRAATDRIQ